MPAGLCQQLSTRVTSMHMSCMDLNDADIIKIVEPMMEDIMLGVSRRDYRLHSSHFSVDLKNSIDSERFLADRDRQEALWGLPGHRDLMSIFRKHKSFTLVWSQHYTRSEDQVVAMTTIALKGGRYFVDFFLLH